MTEWTEVLRAMRMEQQETKIISVAVAQDLKIPVLDSLI